MVVDSTLGTRCARAVDCRKRTGASELVYERATARQKAIEPDVVDGYLRTFAGTEGVLGALGVYRAAFRTIEQTAPLTKVKVRVPVVAWGGEKALGARVGEMVSLVAETVEQAVLAHCGHFLPEECPDEIVRRIQAFRASGAETLSRDRRRFRDEYYSGG